MKAPLPAHEEERLQALQDLGILDSAPQHSCDRLTELAASISTAIAILSPIDSDRQWFKSRVGVSFQQTLCEVAFCAHAILRRDLLVAPDAVSDERVSDEPPVTSQPRSFHAGAPLITPEGHRWDALRVRLRSARI